MKFTPLILLLLFAFCVSAQNVPTKSQLIRIFNSSIDQADKNKVSLLSNAWYICNRDSSFFYSDTIKLYNNINYFYQIGDCCSFVNWTFFRKDAFAQSTSQICEEPASAGAKFDLYNVKYDSEKGRPYFIVSKHDYIVLYHVLNLKEIDLANSQKVIEITLKRTFDLQSKKAITGPVY